MALLDNERLVNFTQLGKYTTAFKNWIVSKFVAKEDGKGLSTNDYTTAEKEKLAAFGAATEYSKTAEVEELITGKGYQTSAQVETAITNKGYQTSAQVEAAITGKGYQTEAQVAAAIAAVDHLKREIVATKPSDAEAKDNIIYMVPNGSAEDGNTHTEYMLIDGKLELIGDTKVDLSNYVTKDDVITDEQIESLFQD